MKIFFHLKKAENDWQTPASKFLGKGKKENSTFQIRFLYLKILELPCIAKRGGGSLFLYKDLKKKKKILSHSTIDRSKQITIKHLCLDLVYNTPKY